MVLEAHRAIPALPSSPSKPYWVGRDAPPAPAPATKPPRVVPKRITSPISIPPLPQSESQPHFTVPSSPANSS